MNNTLIDAAEERADSALQERMVWTSLLCLGAIFPAQFEALISRYYMEFEQDEQAKWMSCSVGNVKRLMARGRKNMKIIVRFIQQALERKTK